MLPLQITVGVLNRRSTHICVTLRSNRKFPVEERVRHDLPRRDRKLDSSSSYRLSIGRGPDSQGTHRCNCKSLTDGTSRSRLSTPVTHKGKLKNID